MRMDAAWIICSLGFSLQLIESQPIQPAAKKSLQWKKSHIELVYPKLYLTNNTKEESSGLHRHLLLVLRTTQETFYIDLTANEDLLKESPTDELKNNPKSNCHYHGTVFSHSDGVAAISLCESQKKLTGTITFDSVTLVLRPLDRMDEKEKISLNLKNATNVRGTDPHVISKVEGHFSQYCGVDQKGIASEKENDFTHPRQFRRSISEFKRKVIETSIFVDNALYEKFIVEEKKSLSELKDTVLAIMNEVQIVLNTSPLTIKLKIAIVKLEILSKEDAPDPADGNIDDYLDNFCSWQSRRNPPQHEKGHWDHAIMLSGYDLYNTVDRKKSKKVVGLGWIGGMCHPQHSCSLSEGTSFQAAFIIAHEMGHSLGMFHDGLGNDCDPAEFLMAEKSGTTYTTWSKCSNDYLKKFFVSGRGACLEEDDSNSLVGRSYSFQDELPGYRFDLDAQCKLSLGSRFQPKIESRKPFNNVCRELWCVYNHWALAAHPALEGSSCGSGKQCIQGKCEEKKVDPRILHDLPNLPPGILMQVIRYFNKLMMPFPVMLP